MTKAKFITCLASLALIQVAFGAKYSSSLSNDLGYSSGGGGRKGGGDSASSLYSSSLGQSQSSGSSYQSMDLSMNFPELVQSGPSYQSAGGASVPAAIQTKRTVEVKPVSIVQEPVEPHIVDVEASFQPVQVVFRSSSSPVMIQQIHTPAQPLKVESTQSEDEPHRVQHQVMRPVIQEVREIIQPYRRVLQEVRPVLEEVRTIVAKAERSAPAPNGSGSGSGSGYGSSSSNSANNGPERYTLASSSAGANTDRYAASASNGNSERYTLIASPRSYGSESGVTSSSSGAAVVASPANYGRSVRASQRKTYTRRSGLVSGARRQYAVRRA